MEGAGAAAGSTAAAPLGLDMTVLGCAACAFADLSAFFEENSFKLSPFFGADDGACARRARFPVSGVLPTDSSSDESSCSVSRFDLRACSSAAGPYTGAAGGAPRPTLVLSEP